ncbi:MAG: hypothetical protein Q9222_001406 [Ikaeria aurantiellina]
MTPEAILPQPGPTAAKGLPWGKSNHGERVAHMANVPGVVQSSRKREEETSAKQFNQPTLKGLSDEPPLSPRGDDLAPGMGVLKPNKLDMLVQEPKIAPRALIVKFSTIPPGGSINSIERRGPSVPHIKSSPDMEPDSFITSVKPTASLSTPVRQTGKKRGRPFGSRNRNKDNWEATTMAEKKEFARKVSEGMRASWARRRQNITTPVASTQALNSKSASQHAAIHHAASQKEPERQLFKGQRAIRSTSGPKFHSSAARSVTNAACSQQSPADERLSFRFEANPEELAKLPYTPGGSSLDDPPGICKDDFGLITIFRVLVSPVLLAVLNRHRSVLPFEDLNAISKQVAEETISEKFRIYIQENNYELDRRQSKLIKKYVLGMFSKKVREARRQIQDTHVLDSFPRQPRMQPDTVATSTQDQVESYDLEDHAAKMKPHKHDHVQLSGKENQTASTGKNLHSDGRNSTEKSIEVAKGESLRASSSPIHDDSLGATSTDKGKAFDPELEAALASAALSDFHGSLPYKSATQGHYDFFEDECRSLLHAIDRVDNKPTRTYAGDTPELRRLLKARLGQASEERMTSIIHAAYTHHRTFIERRKRKSVRAFLIDLTLDDIPPSTLLKLAKPEKKVRDEAPTRISKASSFLRNRELGYDDRAKGQESLSVRVAESICPWRSWKGASGDVVTCAWSPDGLSFAAGAAAQSDDNDLQYNRPRNLLFGELAPNTVLELPNHRVERPKPETISSGPNADYAVYQACDPMVYKTVTSVQFSPWGGLLYTASHDKTAKLWDVSSTPERPSCLATLLHDAEVTSLEVSTYYPGIFATASKAINNAIRVYQPEQQGLLDRYQSTGFSSSRALKHGDWDIFPECIRWGLTPGTKHLLLAGFQKWADEDFGVTRQGQVCLWDVNAQTEISIRPHASSVFAAAWHPVENIFATGGAPGGGPLSYPNITKSVVRLYDPRSTSSYKVEFECPALDMQDVTFHPTNPNYVTASCTDGSTYVWDYRWPDQRMHRLDHGDPLQEIAANEDGLPHYEHLERFDAGVMLSIWGKGASLFYTGSSDGVVKAWDILRSPEDVWVRDVVHLPAGVQSGALSYDGMNMLIGDAVGGVHVLSAAPFGMSSNEEVDDYSDPIDFIAAMETTIQDMENPGIEGIYTSNWLLNNGEMIIHPLFGAGKGHNYQGPLAVHARWDNPESGYCELLPQYDSQQAFSIRGDEHSKQSAEIKALISARREQISAAQEDKKPFVISLGPPTPFVANSQTSNESKSYQTPKPESSRSIPSSQDPPKSPRRNSPSVTASTIRPLHETNSINLNNQHPAFTITPSPPNKKRKHLLSASQSPKSPENHTAKRVKFIADYRHHHPPPSPIAIHPIMIDSIDIIPEIVDLVSDDEVTTPQALAADERNGWAGVSEECIAAEDGEENLLSYEEWIEEDYWWPAGC